MTKRIFTAALVVLASLSQAALACDRLPPDNAQSSVRSVNLSAAWTDAMILQNLKLQIGRAEVTRKESSGSSTVEYAYFHKIVTITRSAAKGVQVKMQEKGQETLNWTLGSCMRTVPGRTDRT